MPSNIDALKKRFREGEHAQAIAGCEALCEQHPSDHEALRLCATMHALVRNYARALELLIRIRNPEHESADVLFNIGMCERELKNFESAQRYFTIYTGKFSQNADGWASLAECRFHLQQFNEAIQAADRAIGLDSSCAVAWTVRGNSLKAQGDLQAALASYDRANQIEPSGESFFNAGLILAELGKAAEAVASFDRAIGLAPKLAPLIVARGDILQRLGKVKEAVADYRVALTLAPSDSETLKKATLCLLESGQGEQALQLCRDILKVQPDNLTARLGAEWVMTQLVPIWHVPMMNEAGRNQAFQDGLAAIVTQEKVVFEIGTGSGLLAMMAAKLGSPNVFTCEAVTLIAETATKIIRRNGYHKQITVLAKPSHAVRLGQDLPRKADILVHEIFSSELLGEHVLPAIEDAKSRLLKPGGEVLPSAASIMIALVGGDAVGKHLFVTESCGFDLREFNAIHPRKRPLYREDLAPILLSDDVEAFRFDFANQSAFPPEEKRIRIRTSKAGLCYGVIQWIRVELAAGIHFENHPSRRSAVSNWQHTVYGFDRPIEYDAGAVVSIRAMHDRSRPWFELASDAP
jgi:tetratricopeptide (TPR) repeat protein